MNDTPQPAMRAHGLTNTEPHQLLIIGGSESRNAALKKAISAHTSRIIELGFNEWQNANWTDLRSPGLSWAIIDIDDAEEASVDQTLGCIQLVNVCYRPERLVVLMKHMVIEDILRALRAGANGILSASAPAAGIVEEIRTRGIDLQHFFPDPNRWLQSLSRAASEIDLSSDHQVQLNKLLRIFVSQLDVERASIMLVEDGNQMRLAAAVGFPSEIAINSLAPIREGSVTDWVIKHKTSRLMIGEEKSGRPLGKQKVETAVSAPMLQKGEVLGTVNFSSSAHKRHLSPSDLSTAEVFASLLSMMISNQDLVAENLDIARLAAIGGTMSGVSHCIKNLLTVFKGSGMIMERALENQDLNQAATGFQIMKNGVRRIENLVLDMLDLTKKRQVEPEPVDLAALIEEIESIQSGSIARKRHTFEIDVQLRGVYMLDEVRLPRAIMNLLSNAVDAIRDGGTVLFSISKENDMIVFAISDNGPGVPPEQLNTIFESFYSTKGSVGTGLGLAMVHKFCEESNGHVQADFDPELGGLRVRMFLPCVVAGEKT